MCDKYLGGGGGGVQLELSEPLTKTQISTPLGLEKLFALGFTRSTLASNINRDSRIEIPQGWVHMIKQHNSLSVPQWTCEGTGCSQNSEDRNPPIINKHTEGRNPSITNSHGAAYNKTQGVDIIA